MEPEREERLRRTVENARKQLAEGTWPEVMEVFGYPNPQAPRVADEELTQLKEFYEQTGCTNMAMFVDVLRFAEIEHGVTMSFNFSMRWRTVSKETLQTDSEQAMSLLSCPDILVGTRRGVEGAASWLKNFSKAVPQLPVESVQIMDKIYGEAVQILQSPSRITTIGEMLDSLVSDSDSTAESPRTSEH